jgi:hypothetical protein
MERSLLFAAIWVVTSPVYAGEIGEIQATSIDLYGFRGIVYFTSQSDGYRVVATISEGENGLPVRFETTLLDGQNMTISVPGKLGEPIHAVEMTRLHSKLTVLQPPHSEPRPPTEGIIATRH